MKKASLFFLLSFLIFSCTTQQEKQPHVPDIDASSNSTLSDSINDKPITQEHRSPIFHHALDFPTIKDSSTFIADLRHSFEFEVDESPYQKEHEKITRYQKVNIYGSDQDYLFIEYDYGTGCGAAYPWKYQFLLTTDGKLIKTLAAQRFEFVEVFNHQNPFLLTVSSTSKGNGGHELFRISEDTLKPVYQGNGLHTYDAHQDNTVYEPNELTLKVDDYNHDGINDLAFCGKIVFIRGQTEDGFWYDADVINGKNISYSVDHPFKKVPVEYIFIYDKETECFKTKETYAITD